MNKKWLAIIIMMMALIPLVSGICCEKRKDCLITETCQDASCGNCTITIFNRDGSINQSQSNMVPETLYTYTINITRVLSQYDTYPYAINCTNNRVCQGDCHVEVKKECEEEEMEGLAITIFLMALNAICFLLPFKSHFSDNEITNYVLKRCMIIFGLFLLSMNTGVVATIAEASGLDVLDELFRYIWIINWTAYILVVALIWTTIQGALKLWQDIANQRRMGMD